jgi:S-adenosylmethionine decarboxylase
VLAEELAAGTHKLTSFRRETPSSIADSQRDPLQEQPFTAAVTL